MRHIALIPVLLLVLAGCDEGTNAPYDVTAETDAGDDVDTGDGSGDAIVDIAPEPVPPPDECEGPNPPPTGPRIDFDVDCEPCLPETEEPRDCRVDEMEEVIHGHVIIHMTCTGGGSTGLYQVETFSDMPMPFVLRTGDRVWFRFFTFGPAVSWTPWYFSLFTEEGKLLLAGIDSPTMLPHDREGLWFTPITVELYDGICPDEPFDCFDEERVALHVTYDDHEVYVFDSNTATIGYTEPYYIQVDNAKFMKNHTCGGSVPGMFMYLIMRIPEI